MDYRSAKPSVQRMILEGIILKDKGIIDSMKRKGERNSGLGTRKVGSRYYYDKALFYNGCPG